MLYITENLTSSSEANH